MEVESDHDDCSAGWVSARVVGCVWAPLDVCRTSTLFWIFHSRKIKKPLGKKFVGKVSHFRDG